MIETLWMNSTFITPKYFILFKIIIYTEIVVRYNETKKYVDTVTKLFKIVWFSFLEDRHFQNYLAVEIALELQLLPLVPKVRDHLELAEIHLPLVILDHWGVPQRICRNCLFVWLFLGLVFELRGDYFGVSDHPGQFGLMNFSDVYTVKKREIITDEFELKFPELSWKGYESSRGISIFERKPSWQYVF